MHYHAPTTRITISLVAGTIVRHDAISNICRQQAEAITRYSRRNQVPVDVRMYTLNTDIDDPRIVTVSDIADIATDDHFLNSDVVLLHFGIYSTLFDAIHLCPPTAQRIVTFHGITAPSVAAREHQSVLYESYEQAVNLHAADQVFATSPYTMAELQRMGIDMTRVSEIPLPVGFEQPPDLSQRVNNSNRSTTRLLYIGRFSPSKGLTDLMQAIDQFTSEKNGKVTLTLMGSRRWCDSKYLESLQTFVRKHKLDNTIRFVFDADDTQLTQHLLNSDALVLPSYHEGFGVPVIEAFQCGCGVICSNAAALPYTSGGLGLTHSPGDVDALVDAIEQFCTARQKNIYPTELGKMTAEQWQARVREHLAKYTFEQFEQHMCKAMFENLQPTAAEFKQYLARKRKQVLQGVLREHRSAIENRSIQRRIAKVLRAEGIACDEELTATPTVDAAGTTTTTSTADAQYLAAVQQIWQLDDEQFIRRLYEILLGQNVRPESLNNYLRMLNEGTNRWRLVEILAHSLEARQRGVTTQWLPQLRHSTPGNYLARLAEMWTMPHALFAQGAYQMLLERQPTASELVSSTRMLDSGTAKTSLIMQLLDKPEAQHNVINEEWLPSLATIDRHDYLQAIVALWSCSDDVFIRQIYRMILGRLPDDSGMASHLAALAAGTIHRPGLVQALAASQEAVARHVDTDWVDALESTLNAYYLHNLERIWRVPTREFVHATYRLVLGRSADEHGFRSMMAELEAGLSKCDVVRALALSDEAERKGVPIGWLSDIPALARKIAHTTSSNGHKPTSNWLQSRSSRKNDQLARKLQDLAEEFRQIHVAGVTQLSEQLKQATQQFNHGTQILHELLPQKSHEQADQHKDIDNSNDTTGYDDTSLGNTIDTLNQLADRFMNDSTPESRSAARNIEKLIEQLNKLNN